MNRHEFFLAAMRAGEYKRTAWVISAFSLIREKDGEWTKNAYPYRIVQTKEGHFFCNPENPQMLLPIEDAPSGQPIFKFKEKVQAKAGDIPNLKKDITTTYGNMLYNCICLVYPFGEKIDYMEGRIKTENVEAIIAQRLVNAEPAGQERDPTKIYADEHVKYGNATAALVAYTQLCVPGCSYKSMTAPPGIKEFREQLLEKYKDRLHDPATIAAIDKELVDYLKAYLKGDSSMGFLLGDKPFNVVRKKLFLMQGAEATLDDSLDVALVTRSLSEGWDIKDLPVMNTASRSGSFNRGAQTELSGEAVKWQFRASSNLAITGKDCGSRMGNFFFARPGEEAKLLGFTAIEGSTDTFIDESNVGAYMGKRVLLRSPMYCRFPKTDLCEACLGKRLSDTPTSLSIAIADIGNVFMGLFMKAMHSNVLELAQMDVETAFV